MGLGVLLTINLKGNLSGFKKHVDNQIVTVDVSEVGAKHPNFISRKIKHSDRYPSECVRKVRVSEEVVNEWNKPDCPHWEKPAQWKSMSKDQRFKSHINRYDEGFGVKYDFVQ